jgi:hypothetical protein
LLRDSSDALNLAVDVAGAAERQRPLCLDIHELDRDAELGVGRLQDLAADQLSGTLANRQRTIFLGNASESASFANGPVRTRMGARQATIIRAAWHADRYGRLKVIGIWNVMPGSRLAADYRRAKQGSPLTFWLGSFSGQRA